jgi:hypothetical protein
MWTESDAASLIMTPGLVPTNPSGASDDTWAPMTTSTGLAFSTPPSIIATGPAQSLFGRLEQQCELTGEFVSSTRKQVGDAEQRRRCARRDRTRA